MIRAKADNDRVIITISLSIGFSVSFSIIRNSNMDAILLCNQINKDLQDSILKTREAEYNQGWKDAKSKKLAKKKWFSDILRGF